MIKIWILIVYVTLFSQNVTILEFSYKDKEKAWHSYCQESKNYKVDVYEVDLKNKTVSDVEFLNCPKFN